MSPITYLKTVLPRGGSLPGHVWERRHRAIVFLLWAHVPGIAIFAVVRGNSLLHGLLEASTVAFFAGLASRSRPSRGFRSTMAALGLLTASATIVHLSGGVIEAHFHFFIMLGVLSMYQDWLPFLVSVGYVVVHHGVIGVLDPRAVYNHPAAWAGPWRWAAIHGALILAASIAYIVSWRLTEDSQAEATQSYRQLLDSEARFRGAFESAPIGVALVGLDGRFLRVNQALCDMLGRSDDDLVDADFAAITHPDDPAMDGRSLLRLAEEDGGGPARTEQRYLSGAGGSVWAELSVSAVHDEGGDALYLVCQIEDITDRKQAEDSAAFLAYHDKLTGLANRAMFEDLLGMAIARARRYSLGVAVLSLDLDDFKLINNTLGHASGDEFLGQVAERLGTITRQTDLVARRGGDEFLLLLADIEGADELEPSTPEGAYVSAESAAQRIQEALREPFIVSGQELYASASIGLSVFPTDAADAGALLKNADAAMYWSKKAGPGGYRVFAQEDVGVPTQLTLATRLRRAVDEQSWILHYQPLVELASRRVFGVEALVRWMDPEQGMISPGEFIPLAEKMGLIASIGEWVIEEMCRQDVVWRAQGLELELSFNVSARQLQQQKLAEKILDPFEIHGVDPRRVVVEITESAAMADPERTQVMLHEFRERGFRVAIDDFGTGYSSLSRLRSLPADILKIDLSFVRDVPTDPQACSIVTGIIRLAEGLGMIPLAEGVETEAQRAFLMGAGCALGQGYLFSRPSPAEDIDLASRPTVPDGVGVSPTA
jgi:diguanylate cyclase (GGDEF)-like protein/PAS domain S-box-containing protein